jgi:spore coat protein U-like protein
MRWVLIACVAAVVMFCASEARAAQCSISTTPVSFGGYNVFASSPTDSLGAVVFNCNGGAKVLAITISAGSGGTFTPRKLMKASEWLGYNLYRDPSRTVVWGNGTSGTSYFLTADVPNKTDISIPVYGRVPAGQDVTAGSYSDSVSVVVNF